MLGKVPDKYRIRKLNVEWIYTINKNILVYSENKTLWLKVTDYKKGYWAEAPLTKGDLHRLLITLIDFWDIITGEQYVSKKDINIVKDIGRKEEVK